MRITIELHSPHWLSSSSSRRRALLALALVLLLALWPLAALASDVFGDVPNTLPQHDAINRVYAAGIMKACTATVPPNFCPNDPVLRAQQASQWDRALGLNGTPNAAVYVGRSRLADVTLAYRLPGPARTILDSSGSVGQYTAVAIGTDGLGLISYYDVTNTNLKVGHCSNPACTKVSLTAVDTTGDVGLFTSLAIGGDGLGLIAYRDNTNADLKVAHCSDMECTTATLSTIDSAGNVGTQASIAIGTDGLGLISYFDGVTLDLKVAHCSNSQCFSATITALDTTDVVGLYTSMTIGADGLGLISYYDATNNDLKVAHCSNTACTTATTAAVDAGAPSVGEYSSIAIGADGLGLISYHDATNDGLKVAHCSDTACTSATTSFVDGSGSVVGVFTSIAIGVDGLGLISYHASTPGLKIAHCSNIACSAATITTVDAGGGLHSSLAIGADGLGLFTYFDLISLDLKAAHCANIVCTPFFRSSRY